jgi:hypothetical protein
MTMNKKTMRSKARLHPEALSWRRSAVVAGGTVSATTLKAVSDFCYAIDRAGLRSSFLRLNLICGGNREASFIPLYRGPSANGTQYGSVSDTNVDYSDGDYSQSTGLSGDSQNEQHLDTTLTIGTVASFGADYGNVHMSIYNRSSTFGPQFGGFDNASAHYSNGIVLNTGPNSEAGISNGFFSTGSNGFLDHVATSRASLGFTLAMFLNSSTAVVESQGSELTAVVSDNYGNGFYEEDLTPIWFGGCFAEPGYNVFANGQLSAYSIGKAAGTNLSNSTGRTAFYAAMDNFQRALSRHITEKLLTQDNNQLITEAGKYLSA